MQPSEPPVTLFDLIFAVDSFKNDLRLTGCFEKLSQEDAKTLFKMIEEVHSFLLTDAQEQKT